MNPSLAAEDLEWFLKVLRKRENCQNGFRKCKKKSKASTSGTGGAGSSGGGGQPPPQHSGGAGASNFDILEDLGDFPHVVSDDDGKNFKKGTVLFRSPSIVVLGFLLKGKTF